MARPLSAPTPWLTRAVAEAPADLRWLWLRMDLADAQDPVAALTEAFTQARTALAKGTKPQEIFVRVQWSPALLSNPERAAAVAGVQAEGLAGLRLDGHQVDGWVPACADPAMADDLALFATPPHCETCPLYAARTCRGEGRDLEPFARLPRSPPPALPPADPESWGPESCLGNAPLACWWPEADVLDRFAAEAKAAGGRVWDLGGGNGWLAARLAQRGLEVTVVERHPPPGPPPAGVDLWSADVLDLPGDRAPPDAVVLSWPPTGAQFGAVVSRLKPKVLLWATDASGRCGVRPGQAGLSAGPSGVQWYLPEMTDDFRFEAEFWAVIRRETPGLAGQRGEAVLFRR